MFVMKKELWLQDLIIGACITKDALKLCHRKHKSDLNPKLKTRK